MLLTYILIAFFLFIGVFQIIYPKKSIFILWRWILKDRLAEMPSILVIIRLAGVIIVLLMIYAIVTLL